MKKLAKGEEPGAARGRLDLGAGASQSDLNEQLSALGRTRTVLPKGVSLPLPDEGQLLASDKEPAEPVYSADDLRNIQGNIVPGFNKDHQHFLFLRIADVAQAKAWLRWLAPLVSPMHEVLSFVRQHRALRLREGTKETPLRATWVNVGFSYGAIKTLVSAADADAFGDESFRQGLAERSTFLGDPVERSHQGHRENWRVGGPGNEADIIVIIAADDAGDLQNRVDTIRERALESGLGLLFEQPGETLPEPLRGHEHFGFKDGVSQPGVRGKASSARGDFITPRYLAPDDPRFPYFAKPGQVLLWPGQFLMGEPRQHPDDLRMPAPDVATKFPTWAKQGSYLVCRRLRQNVPAFWDFAVSAANATGLSPVKLASMLVGRWPSGAPLMRSPQVDDAGLAGDPWANNHFIFDDNTRPSSLLPIPGYPGDTHLQAGADVLGAVCPHFSHVRKINPRDAATDLGKAQDTLLRMVLRRGIPFGPPIAGVTDPAPDLVGQERGLMFLSYGATIEDQFEFLTRRWANSPLQPNDGGFDPIIGQTDGRNGRARYIDFPSPSGTRAIDLPQDWVIPTGGGYFFAPPITAIAGTLGA
jgi:Dyp-type peroxidase family